MKKISYSCIALLMAAAGHAQIGFGTTVPNSNADVRGGMAITYRSFTGNTAVTATDYSLVFTGSTAATATLPDAAACAGRIYWIKNGSTVLPTPVVTISTTSSQTIDAAAGWVLDEPKEVIRIVSNGTNWDISSQNIPTAKTGTTGSMWNQGGINLKSLKAVGASTNFDFALMTNNAEGMRINTSGFLGMGTNNPTGRLHFVNDNSETGNDYYFDDYLNGTSVTAGFFIRKFRGTTAAPLNLQAGDMMGQVRFSGRYNGALTNAGGSGIDAFYQGDGTTNLSDFRFFSSDAERLRINENGNTAVGATVFDGTNPEKLLVDAGNTASYNVISGKGTIDNYLQLNIQNKSNGINASSDVVSTANNGSELVNYIDMGINSNNYSNTGFPVLSGVDQTYLYSTANDFVIGNTGAGRDLIFFTNAYALTNERMRITAGGNVGIGNVAVPADKLTVAGIVSPAADNTYSIGTTTNRWSTVWSANGTIQTSDIRLKTAIAPLEYGTKELMQLQPVTYQWKDKPGTAVKIGLIAQQVQKIIPELVTGNTGTSTLGMNYAEMVTVLINTIKEQQAQLKKLQNEMAILKQQVK